MARISTIDPAEVFTAIRAILAAGGYPNPSNVRRQLGNRGSTPVLQRMIGEWYSAHGPQLSGGQAVEATLPTAALQAELERLTKATVGHLTEQQRAEDARLQALAEALNERTAVLDARERDLEERESRQNQRELDHAQFVQALTHERDAAVRSATELSASLAALQAVHESTLKQLAMHKERDELQQKELQRLNGIAGELKVARELAEASRKHASDQMVAARTAQQRADEAQKDLVASQEQAHELSRQLEQVRLKMADARETAQDATERLVRLQAELDASRAGAAQAAADNVALQTRLEASARSIDTLQSQLRQLQLTREFISEHEAATRDAIKSLEAKLQRKK